MTENQRWEHLINLDDELLKGGIILSEWCCFIVCEAEKAFASGAYLASILTAVSGIETYLRSEYSITGKERLVELINQADIHLELKNDIHTLRRYRNKWVHVDDPREDDKLFEQPELVSSELEEMAFTAARILRKTIYENSWI